MKGHTNKHGQFIPHYTVQKKNIYTKNQWQDVDNFPSLPMADAKADHLKNEKFIMGKDWSGTTRPSPKTQTRIVKSGRIEF